jgi:protein-S-isoprenylcysteine O-methyltransferase Ste14
MPDLIFKAAFILGLLGQIVIRAPYDRQRRQNKIVKNNSDRQEQVLLILLFLGGFLLPLLYIFTPWLNFANYILAVWLRGVGVVILLGSLWVFWRAHHDLGRNWSPSLEIRADHDLVTHGIYESIRHPMYASQWLWIIAQPLLLTNWLAGLGGLVAFALLYFIRVPIEEKMMQAEFGAQYAAYQARSGRVVPKIGK